MALVNNLPLAALKGLFPQHCLLCGLPSRRDLPLCHPCEAELPANNHCCRRCALPLAPLPTPAGSGRDRICGACLAAPPPFASATAPWLYSEQLAFILQRWKYGHDWRLTALLGYLWRQQAGQHPMPDLLVPVPLHWRKRWRRGVNQAELLCRQLQRGGLVAPVNTHLVRRHRSTRAQSALDAGERRANVAGAFTVRGRCDNLDIAIVDDVLTTGATAASLSRALLDAGAASVRVWCLARTPPPGPAVTGKP